MSSKAITRELEKRVMSAPSDQNAQEETLWTEQWNKIMWGPQYELDLMDSKQAAAAQANAQVSGNGMQLGKGKRHWSQAAIHSSYYEPCPFDLQFCVVDASYTFPGTRWPINSAQPLRKSEIIRWRQSRESHQQALRPTCAPRERCRRPRRLQSSPRLQQRPELETDREGMACVV